MRRCFLLLLVGLVPQALLAQTPLPRTFAVARDVSLRIWVPAGSVRLETWDRDSIRVSGTVAPSSRFFGGGMGRGAKLGVDNFDVRDTTLARGALVVTVPRLAHVWIKMTEGQVTAAGTAGELEVITVAGSITVQDSRGVVAIETIDAAVMLSRIDGAVRIRSGGGRVLLAELRGTLTATTVSGDVEVSGKSLQDSRIETIGGGITIRGSVARSALLDLETHNGPISLVLDRAALPMMTLSSRGGRVTNPLGSGSEKFGSILARTFKGAINVTGATGIEGRKPNSPP